MQGFSGKSPGDATPEGGVQRGSPADIFCVACLCAVFVSARLFCVIHLCVTLSFLVFLYFISLFCIACFASV